MNEMLKDLLAAGVKWELGDTAIGFLSDLVPPTAPARTRVFSTVVPPIAPVAPVSIETVRACAMRPTTTSALCRMISEFNHPLRGGATNVVLPYVADNPNGVLIITDIPSSEDDASGKILSGGAGELLDKMLAAIGMSRDNVNISPIVFWRTPGGRTPTRNELDLSRPFLDRFIELTEPRIIITLGTVAASEICATDLMRNHGTETILPNGVHAFSVYHPNYLILKPTAKAAVWTVLQNIQNLLKNL